MKKIASGLLPLLSLTSQAKKPNILILFADDQRADAFVREVHTLKLQIFKNWPKTEQGSQITT